MKKNQLQNLKRIAFMVMLFVFGGQLASMAQCTASYTVTYDSTGTIAEFHPTYTGANPTGFAWTFGDGGTSIVQQPTHAYNFTGYVMVCLTIDFTGGCQAVFCDSVLTRQGGVTSCQAYYNFSVAPSGVLFSDYSTSSDPIVSYDWDFGDGTIGNGSNPFHAYVTPGTYTACLTITSSTACTDTYCSTITIQGGSAGCFANFTSSPVLGTTLVDFMDLSTADSGATIISYTWDFGDSIGTSNLQNPTYAYGAPGSYWVCLSIQTSSGCASTSCGIVNSGNVNSCSASWTASLNPGTNAIDFTDFSTTNDSIIRWEWTFGDGDSSININPSHNYAVAGTYNVCLTIFTASFCSDTYCSTIYYPGTQNCSAIFSAQVSPSNTGVFYCNYNNPNAMYAWDFGDGSTLTQQGGSTITHQYLASGTFLVCLSVQDSSCSDSSCSTITVGSSSACAAMFTFSVDSTGTEFTFANYSTPASNYFWSFGDGTASTVENPVHLYNQPGPHTVCLTVVDSATGCTDTFCNSISAANACDPVFVALPDTSNPAGTPMNFTVISPCGTPTSIIIDFGDGTIQTISGSGITYVYANPGTYNVCVCEVIGPDTLCFCDSIVAYRLMNGIPQIELSNIHMVAYPNPFSTALNVEYTLEKNAAVSVQIVGIAGNIVTTTQAENLSAGTYRQEIKTDDLAAGFYILKLNVNGVQISKKVNLQK